MRSEKDIRSELKHRKKTEKIIDNETSCNSPSFLDKLKGFAQGYRVALEWVLKAEEMKK